MDLHDYIARSYDASYLVMFMYLVTSDERCCLCLFFCITWGMLVTNPLGPSRDSICLKQSKRVASSCVRLLVRNDIPIDIYEFLIVCPRPQHGEEVQRIQTR